jgi:hypothetical protein
MTSMEWTAEERGLPFLVSFLCEDKDATKCRCLLQFCCLGYDAVSQDHQIQLPLDTMVCPGRIVFNCTRTAVEISELSSAPYLVSRSKILMIAC